MKSSNPVSKGRLAAGRGFIYMLSIALCLASFLFLVGCGSSDDTSADSSGYDLTYSDRDQDPSYDKSTAAAVKLADGSITVDGSGASSSGSVLTIDSEGTYILSGSLSDGQIVIDTPDDEKVQLVLDGVSVSSNDSAPLLIKESDKVFVTLAEGSTNTLTGPSSYSDAAEEDNIDGVIFSKGDMCINGSGSLTIKASTGHGIVSKDDLIITGGTIKITAAGDGLQGKDCVKIKDGSITIDVDNDGIRSSNSEDEYRGFISVDGGSFSIDAGYDGLQAETLLRVAGGSFDITTGGGSGYSSTQDDWGESWGGKSGDHGGMMGGQPGGMSDPGSSSKGSSSTDSSEDTVSAKGLKAGLTLLISGGDLDIDSSDDAVHSNGDVDIESGSILISSGDDGIHADSDLKITDGTIDVTKCYEGFEGNTVTIDGGTSAITASDDGLNAAGGSDSSSMDRPGANDFSSDESAFIVINGGKLDISASGDGIDSNGSLEITGGTMTVTCPTTGDTAVLDYETEGTITGGTFIGTGAVQMAMTFSSSQQGVVAVNVGNQSAGADITLKDSSGNTIITHSPDENFAVAILSSPDIVSGETYTISVGSVSGDITAD